MIELIMQVMKYYYRLVRLLGDYKGKKTRLKSLPLKMWLELTSLCNLKCIMCPNKDLMEENRGFIDFQLFKKVVDEAKGFICDINFSHRGESLMHPDFIKMLKYATQFLWKTKLHTNGTLLNREMARGIIEAQLRRLSFSFDGYQAEEYQKVRVGAKFDLVVNNIKEILKLRKKMNSKYPKIVLEFIDLPHSQIADKQKRRSFLQQFIKLGLDQVVVKKMHNWAGFTGPIKKQHKVIPCTFLWNGMLVLWNGTVMPCAQDFFEYYPLENVRDKSLKEIWNGERLVSLRKKHLTGNIGDIQTCRNCDRIYRKTFLGIPSEYLSQLLFRKMP